MKADANSAYVTKIINSTPSSYNYKEYVGIVKNFSAKRKMINTFTAGVNMCYNGKTPDEIRTSVSNELDKVTTANTIENHSYNMTDALENAVQATKDAAEGTSAFKSGIDELDELISVQKSELITIAAPTSQGKTAFLATIVLNSARQGKKWLVFTLEGGHIPFTQRLQALRHGE